jgi:hypothetical protein
MTILVPRLRMAKFRLLYRKISMLIV